MYDSDNTINDFRLTPNPNERFEGKVVLKRSELLGYEGSLLDEMQISAAEADEPTTQAADNVYVKLKLKANTHDVMPNKNSLKRKPNTKLTFKHIATLTIPVAAMLLLSWFLLKQGNDNTSIINPTNKIAQSDSSNTQPQTIIDNKPEDHLLIKTDSSTYQPTKPIIIKPKKIIKPKDILVEQAHINTYRDEIQAISKIENKTTPMVQFDESNLTTYTAETPYSNIEMYVDDNLIENDENWSAYTLVKGIFTPKRKKQPWFDHVLQQRLIALNSLLGKESIIIHKYDSTGTLVFTSIDSDGINYAKSYAVN